MLQRGDSTSVDTASTVSDAGLRQEAESQPAKVPQSLAVSRPKRRQATKRAYTEESEGEWEADWNDEDDLKVFFQSASF